MPSPLALHGPTPVLGPRIPSSPRARCVAVPPARAARRTVARAAPGDGGSVPKVVALGEALFDCLADQIGLPKEQVTSWTPYPGGAPLNVATACAQLGIPTAFVSAIGKDELGDKLVALMEKKGVDMSGLTRIDKPTRDVLVERKEGGDRVFAGFGSPTETYADCFVGPEMIPVALVAGAEVMVMGTLGLAQPETARGMKFAAEEAQKAGTAVLVDVNWRPVFWADPAAALGPIKELLSCASMIKLTDEEAEWLVGMPAAEAIKDPATLESKVKAVAPNCRGILVTGGEAGAAYSFGGVSGIQPVLDISVKDTTGAGDAFTAGFVFCLTQAGGLDKLLEDPKLLGRAVAFASACGALTCSAPGAIDAQPSSDAVLKLMREQTGYE
ncbi:unnamed protein product [Pedinophyceae sp. YPF-701]|nr:unnamed protein product [Pedinophyceae sp. YPF-701]